MDTIANKFFLDIFYRLCAEFVQFYPKASYDCDRLQTFAAIESYADLNTPNLGKSDLDRGKPFFFSRKWAAAQYNPSQLSATDPIMTAFEEPGLFVDPFNTQMKAYYNIQVAFLGKYEPSNKKTKDHCKNRTRNEIYLKSEEFARQFFSYLSDVAYFTGQGFFNRNVAPHVLETVPEEDAAITRQFVKMLREENKQVQHVRWEGGINDLYGTYITIKLCAVTCEQFAYDAPPIDYRLGWDRGCC